MSLNLGNTTIDSLYVGSTKIGSAYLGSTKVYEYVDPFPYRTVTIGTQTWTAENLTIDDGQGGIYTRTVNYGNGNITEYYYTWDAAIRVANSISGWHLPTRAEWTTLATVVGGVSTAGTKLKSMIGWSSGNGDGSYGFAAYPAGNRNSYNGKFYDLGYYTEFWTADQSSYTSAYYREFSTRASMMSSDIAKAEGHSVRLVKDTI